MEQKFFLFVDDERNPPNLPFNPKVSTVITNKQLISSGITEMAMYLLALTMIWVRRRPVMIYVSSSLKMKFLYLALFCIL